MPLNTEHKGNDGSNNTHNYFSVLIFLLPTPLTQETPKIKLKGEKNREMKKIIKQLVGNSASK